MTFITELLVPVSNPDSVQGQGTIDLKSGAYTSVREHFQTDRNAAIGQYMGFEAGTIIPATTDTPPP